MIFVVFYLYQPVKKTFMKINRKLIAAFACLSVVFGACTKTDNVDAGVDLNAAGPNVVTYDEVGSSSSTLAVYWDAAPAINAGATSFTVQLLKNLEDTPDSYDASVSQTLLVNSNYVGSPAVQEGDKVACDQAVFANLAKGKIYYVRVRANYPMSKMSKWVLCSDEAGEAARIKVGKGLIGPDEVEDKTAPTAKMVEDRITAADAIVTWSTFNWANNNADFGMAYSLTLKKGNELVVKWNLPADGSAAGIWKYAKKGCRWIFTGLEAETEYTVIVENTTDGVAADPVKFTTKKSQVVTLPTAPAAAGDIILYEDFANLIITGDYASYASGYSYEQRSQMDVTWKATGDDPVKNDDGVKGCYLVDASTEVGMFNTIKGLVATTRLADWGMMAEDDTKGAICARTGYVKMGASSKCAWLCTPELTCLAQPAQVELSFDAALYDSDPRTAIIEVLGGTTIEVDNNRFVRPSTRFTAAQFEVGSEAGAWAHYTFVIDGVMPGNRIAIGGDRNGVDGQHRFYLDNICVKVLSYGKLTLSAPENLVLAATDKTIDATWDAVANTKAYVVEYKAKDAAEWTALTVAEPKATIEGLAFETEYEVRVKATADDVESEYSAVATIKTLAEIKKLGTPVISETYAGLAWATLKFPAVLNATNYEVYANGGAEKIVSEFVEKDGTVTLVAGGLALNSSNTFQVKAVAEGIESSDLSAATAAIATGAMSQFTNNVGPTIATVDWTGCEGDFDFMLEISDASGKLMGTIALPDAKMTSELTDGSSATQFGGVSSVYWNKEEAVPCRFTIGALQASTTYKVRVKPMLASDAIYSPYFEVTTAAAHTAVANEVLFQSFDEMWYGGDYINFAAGLYPADGSKLPEPTWEGYIANAKYVLSLSSNTNVSASKLPSLIGATTEGYTLSGWSFSNLDCRPSHCKLGGGSKPGTMITKELGAAVLNADAATKCTVSMNVSPMSDGTPSAAEAQIIIVHADGTETTLDAISVFQSADQSAWDFKWKKIEWKDVELKSTDKIKFTSVNTSTNACRYLIDEILVVKQ